MLGVGKNAAMTVGNTVASQTTVFASSMSSALWPTAMNAYGEGNMERTRVLASQASKIGALTILVFAIPVILEVDELLVLWLKTPPPSSGILCICIIASVLIDQLTNGFTVMINASGKIAWLSRCFIAASFARICLTTLLVEAVFVPLTWFLIFTRSERAYVADKILAKLFRKP